MGWHNQNDRHLNRLVMPSWWVAAFDILGKDDRPDDSPCALSRRMGVAPALNRPELDSMGTLLHSLQVQLLAGRREPVVSVSEHSKAASYQVRRLRFAYDRLLQLAGSLQLLPSHGESHGSGWPLFSSVTWEEERGRDDWAVHFKISQDSDELIFGYVEPYLELRRFWSKKERIGKYYLPQPPLKLWQSAWLDLQGFEQIVLVRLERLIQWEQAELSFSQIHDLPLEELFSGVRFRQYGEDNLDAMSEFRQLLQKLSRLGRKLGDHGLIAQPDAEDCLVASSSQKNIGVIWKTSSLYRDEIYDYSYESALSVRYARKALAKFDDLVRLIAGPNSSSQTDGGVQSFVEELLLLDDEELLLLDSDLVVIYRSLPALVHPILIYLEWWLRLVPNHPYPLADWAAESPYAEILRKAPVAPDIGNYRLFIDSIRSQESPRHELSRLFSICFACPSMLKKQELIRHLAKTTKQQARNDSVTKLRPQELPQKQYVKAVKPAGSPAVLEKNFESKQLKREAIEALRQIQANNYSHYVQLKKAYIDSLTDEKRKLIKEVESRLKPAIFDEHLRNSLVKFLMEHPSLWKKSENS